MVCSNKAANVSAFSYLTITIPELGITQTDGPNVFVPSDQQTQRARAGTWAELPVTAGDTFTVTARGDAYNTGTNADNYLSIDALAIFQY
ncbi:hypothetical protein ATY41_03385 [Leifsonia xyli subsp. xyli]|uniref:Uncharacterized protein n=2 Tax=Leifsonia xyli subsp. xyli TaxID=59736 RepID=Q6AH56_LEIXX|nr:hypothetical protein [Leifsonia xyli]AAT88289.1 hypothetical protein Lxx02460 [Leifsonia xyli subsp. xyli str. CTCB07]ODA89729.1 hypothetical protein ATY41_03385 [Leifsonia xyli subsp. xyli]